MFYKKSVNKNRTVQQLNCITQSSKKSPPTFSICVPVLLQFCSVRAELYYINRVFHMYCAFSGQAFSRAGCHCQQNDFSLVDEQKWLRNQAMAGGTKARYVTVSSVEP